MTNWHDSKSKVSKHFTVGDVTNNDARRIPQGLALRRRIRTFARKLDRIADEYGDLRINSWYRPPAINKAVGGAPSSRHIEGDAADLTLAKGTARQKLKFEQSLDKTWTGGIGRGHAFGKGYLHIDTGPKRRWNYN